MEFLLLCFVALLSQSYSHEAKDFDDSILYKIEWLEAVGPADAAKRLLVDDSKFDRVKVTTRESEQYSCSIPISQPKEEKKTTLRDSTQTPYDVIIHLLSAPTCSYRIEAYWTYEICHGNHVRQYHEERDGRTVKVQEFYLGKWTEAERTKFKKDIEEEYSVDGKKTKERKIDSVTIDNVQYPVLDVKMTDGTLCDLNNQPRTVTVRYICFQGKNEVYSLRETSSCNYEFIIYTPVLCLHPLFQPEDTTENVISCLPVNVPNNKPYSLLVNELENLKNQMEVNAYAAQTISQIKDNIAIIKVGKDGRLDVIAEGQTPIEGNLKKLLEITNSEAEADETPANLEETTTTPKTVNLPKFSKSPEDMTPIKDFLTGKICLTGGTGWWKFEFCYGEYVRQFHVDKNSETSMILGYFNEYLHREWMKLNPEKRPKPDATLTGVTHFYQGGTMCDKTGEKRQIEVKLKCLPNAASSTTVSMYLLEPKTCQYILVVESPIICELLHLIDEDGLVPPQDTTPAESSKTKSTMIIDDITIRYEND